MKICVASLESVTPYSQSSAFKSEKEKDESHDQFEKRAWRERMHVNDAGEVFIPAMQLKYSLDEACKRIAPKVSGARGATWTKFFQAGIYVPEGPSLGVKRDDVPGEWVYCHADGKKTCGTRVWRCFPVIAAWKADVKFMVLDEKIPNGIFEEVLTSCGLFVGLGRFRPEKQGYYGRFRVVGTKWSEA